MNVYHLTIILLFTEPLIVQQSDNVHYMHNRLMHLTTQMHLRYGNNLIIAINNTPSKTYPFKITCFCLKQLNLPLSLKTGLWHENIIKYYYINLQKIYNWNIYFIKKRLFGYPNMNLTNYNNLKVKPVFLILEKCLYRYKADHQFEAVIDHYTLLQTRKVGV